MFKRFRKSKEERFSSHQKMLLSLQDSKHVVFWDLSEHQHLLIVGPEKSGKTSLLLNVMQQIHHAYRDESLVKRWAYAADFRAYHAARIDPEHVSLHHQAGYGLTKSLIWESYGRSHSSGYADFKLHYEFFKEQDNEFAIVSPGPTYIVIELPEQLDSAKYATSVYIREVQQTVLNFLRLKHLDNLHFIITAQSMPELQQLHDSVDLTSWKKVVCSAIGAEEDASFLYGDDVNLRSFRKLTTKFPENMIGYAYTSEDNKIVRFPVKKRLIQGGSKNPHTIL